MDTIVQEIVDSDLNLSPVVGERIFFSGCLPNWSIRKTSSLETLIPIYERVQSMRYKIFQYIFDTKNPCEIAGLSMYRSLLDDGYNSSMGTIKMLLSLSVQDITKEQYDNLVTALETVVTDLSHLQRESEKPAILQAVGLKDKLCLMFKTVSTSGKRKLEQEPNQESDRPAKNKTKHSSKDEKVEKIEKPIQALEPQGVIPGTESLSDDDVGADRGEGNGDIKDDGQDEKRDEETEYPSYN